MRALSLLALPFVIACHTTTTGPGPSGSEVTRESTQRVNPNERGQPTVAASPRAVLGKDGVLTLQAALMEQGYDEVKSTGMLDETTRRAMAKFQKKNGLPETGFPDDQTLRDLGVNEESIYGVKRMTKKEARKEDATREAKNERTGNPKAQELKEELAPTKVKSAEQIEKEKQQKEKDKAQARENEERANEADEGKRPPMDDKRGTAGDPNEGNKK